jgi:hypothetical protein
MGYYSVMELDVSARSEKVDALKKAMEAFLKGQKDSRLAGHLADLKVDPDGSLYFATEDFLRKWQDEALAVFLSSFVQAGEIRMTGEDGERWGYAFDGKGGVYSVSYRPVRKRIRKRDAWKAFASPLPAPEAEESRSVTVKCPVCCQRHDAEAGKDFKCPACGCTFADEGGVAVIKDRRCENENREVEACSC